MTKIPVTKTFLPALEDYTDLLSAVWENGWVTNNGELVQQLEKRLINYLNLKHLFFVSNGTIALQIAIKALGLKGEIITTPFTYVATTSSIVWEGCTPVFVDIEPNTLTINESLIENAITPNTCAIMATHVYGNPCNVETIEQIATKYHLKVIYDGAHAFGVRFNDRALADYGDITVLSFHATKLFHTIEGGALVTRDNNIANKILHMRNFGHHGYDEIQDVGINGKNSEVHAAMGLLMLPKIKKIILERKKISMLYESLLDMQKITQPILRKNTQHNYIYFPIIFPTEKLLLKAVQRLEMNEIFPRRYFFPSLSNLNYVSKCHTPIADDVSKKVLCLPLYVGLETESIHKIAEIVNSVLN